MKNFIHHVKTAATDMTRKKKFEKTQEKMTLLKPVGSVGYSTYFVIAAGLITCKEEETQCPH
jgi:hypothetical protein